jgi:putative heme-binding domain-containing protein
MRILVATSFAVGLVFAQDGTPRPLFDGTSLAGWRGDPRVWKVVDGLLQGSSVGVDLKANTFLVLDGQEPADFVFEAGVLLQGDNNSGVQYRSREMPGATFKVGGYQCDWHPAPKYTAMLYDEQGAGIVAERGTFVLWNDASRRVIGDIAVPQPVDGTKWHTLRIVAMGDLVWHELDGELATAVADERKDAPRSGVLALQVHAGKPMTVQFRGLSLRTWNDVAAMRRDVPVPAALTALRAAAAKAKANSGTTAAWLWDKSPEAEEELFFRRAFALSALPKEAKLVVACDNHCRVYVNGEKVGEGDEWESPLQLDVHKALRPGRNVLAVHGWNDGGPAAMAARLSWPGDGVVHEVVTDASWTCSADDPDGWMLPEFGGAGFGPVTVLGALGDPKLPWSGRLGADAFGTGGDPLAPQVARLAPEVTFPASKNLGPVLKLLEVPRSLGSWVSLAVDPKGRVYAGAQGGGLFRVTPAGRLGEPSTIEKMPVELTGAHGLLWWRNALYAVVNERNGGLYRLRDTNGDDVLDASECLQKLDGSGEHGPHSVVVAPDGEHLLVVCGNHTKLPPLAASRVPTNWAEDRLLPRLEDPHKYWEGISPPGGWVCQCDADGKNWELITCGFRNPYDIAALPSGQVVVFDADMEWDLGLPWYRPTRILAVHSGVDYGWRIGSAKWSVDYPDSPPPVQDIGPGSPTGMAVVHDSSAQSSHWLALDWTFGVIYRDGAPFLSGAPLPVTDVAVEPGVTFVATGGRGLPSALLRVPQGDDVSDPKYTGRGSPRNWGRSDPWSPQERRDPATILATVSQENESAVRGWDSVYARIALERLPVAQWRSHVLAPTVNQPTRSLAGFLALARQGTKADLGPLLDALGTLPFAPLSHHDRIAWLRAHALALLRLGPPDAAQRARVAERLLPLFPTGSEGQDQDLAELLAFVDAPGLLDKLVPALAPLRPSPVPAWADTAKRVDVYGDQYGGVIRAMVQHMPPIGQLAIADALRTVKHGWTLDQRRAYFTFLAAARKQKGGASYDGFLKRMIDAAWATCTPAEQQALAELVGMAKADAPKFAATPPKGPGRDWQVGDIDGIVRDGFAGRDLQSGRNLFHAASCASCHYFAGEGGNHGPDLTSLGNKFTARDVLEAILEPSKVVSDQFTGQVLTKKDGSTLFGFATKGHHGDVEVWEVMPAAAEAAVVRVPVADVVKVEKSPLSPMPADLVDRLSRDELRDLVAFLLSRGQGLPAK